MPAKSKSWIGRTLDQVCIKIELLPEFLTSLQRLGLASFCVPNGARCGQEFLGSRARRKEDPVSVSEHDICSGYLHATETCRDKAIAIARIQSLGACRAGTVAEDRETNPFELRGISVASPNDHTGQTAGLGFQGGQVSNTAFIGPAPIVYHQDISWLGHPHRLQENIHTPKVSHGHSATGNLAARRQRTHA
jgi:hypothetical protein